MAGVMRQELSSTMPPLAATRRSQDVFSHIQIAYWLLVGSKEI